MLDAETRACFTQVPQTSRMLGVDLPKPVADAINLSTVRPPDVAAPTTVELAEALAAAVEADRDPAADPTVQTLLTRRQLAELNIGYQLAGHAEHQLGQAIKNNAEAIVASWRKALAADSKALAAAKDTLGPLNAEDVVSMRSPRPEVAAAWAVSRTSGARFDTAVGAWWILARAAGVPCNPYRRACVYGPATAEQHRALPARPTAWETVCAGIDLDLATYETWAERNRALDDEQAGLVAEGNLRMKIASGGFVARVAS